MREREFYLCQSKTILILLSLFSDKIKVNSETLKYYLFRTKQELSDCVKPQILSDIDFDQSEPRDILNILFYFDFEITVRGPDNHLMDHTIAMLDVTEMIETTSSEDAFDTRLILTKHGQEFVNNLKVNVGEKWQLYEKLSEIILKIHENDKEIVEKLYSRSPCIA